MIYKILLICHIFSVIIAGEFSLPLGWKELHNENDWEVVKENSKARVLKKTISVTSFPAYRVESKTTVSPSALINTVWQIDRATLVFENSFLTHSGIYETHDENHQSVYQIIDIPFLSPRLYQFDFFRNNNNINWVQINHKHIDLDDDIIIPSLNFGSWEFLSNGTENTIIYRVCTNPEGNIPNWMVEQANRKYLPQMLHDLEKWAQED